MKEEELWDFLHFVNDNRLVDRLPKNILNPLPAIEIREHWRKKYENLMYAIARIAVDGLGAGGDRSKWPEKVKEPFFDFVDFVFGTLPPKEYHLLAHCLCKTSPAVFGHAKKNRDKEIILVIAGWERDIKLEPYKNIDPKIVEELIA